MHATPARARTTLDPKLDIVFWMLFGAEQNRELLLSLLNAVLRPEVPIVAAEVLHAQPERARVDDKSIALDLRVRLENGEQVDVEMQSQRRPGQRERALYYWSRLYASQLPRGASYQSLRRCVVVMITAFIELASPYFHSIFQLRDPANARLLTSHLEIHFVELPKLRTALDRNDETALRAWGKFLAAAADEELEELAMENPLFQQAKAALDRLSADSEARLRAEQRELALLSYELHLATAREQGEAEGRARGEAEGRAKGEAELLLRLLTLKFGELSSEAAQRLREASAADVERWSARLLDAASLEAVFEQP